MSRERENAIVDDTIILRIKFQYSQTGDYFDPYDISQVVILDSDGTTVLETITGASIIHDSLGNYHVLAAAVADPKTIYDKWYFTPAEGNDEITKTNPCIVWAETLSPSEGYCTVTDVARFYLGKTFTDSDYVTQTDLENMIADEARTMDTILRRKYTLPITDEDDLRVLKKINQALVVAILDEIYREKTVDGKFNRDRSMIKQAQDLLSQINKGEVTLNSSRKASAIKFGNTDGDGNIVEKRFVDAEIEPSGLAVVDRETHTIVRFGP